LKRLRLPSTLSKPPRIVVEPSSGFLLEAVPIKASDYKASDYSAKWIAPSNEMLQIAFLDPGPFYHYKWIAEP
jgi:hypothetical protein